MLARKLFIFPASLFLILFSLGKFLLADGIGMLEDLDLPRGAEKKTAYYEILSAVPAKEPGWLQFRVAAPHAEYEVEGVQGLLKLLHEITVIEKIRRREMGSGFEEGVEDSVKATGRGFARLVSHPVESGKGIKTAAGKLGRGFGGVFRRKEKGESSSFGEKLLGGSERELAKEFQVDVYTANPHLRKLLRDMAKARMGGKGAVTVGKILLPVAGLASVALTASGVNAAADQVVNDSSRGELFSLNKEALLKLGFEESLVRSFLNLPYYSPREATYVRFYLEKMKGVEGSGQVLEKSAKAESLWAARKILYTLQIAAERMSPSEPYARMEWTPEGLGLQTGETTVLILPYDDLELSGRSAEVLDQAADLRKSWGSQKSSIWNAGKIPAVFSVQAGLRGVKTRDCLLWDKNVSA